MRICRFRRSIGRGSIPRCHPDASEASGGPAFMSPTGLENARVSEPNRDGSASGIRREVISEPSRVVTGRDESKSFVAVRLSMKNASVRAGSPVSSVELCTRLASLSTRPDVRMQLRDIVFVSRASTGSYITTGVETRTLIECRPTPVRPVVETESRVSHRIVTHSISSR